MTKEQFDTYYNPNTIENCRHYLGVVLDAYFVMMDKTHQSVVHTAREQYAQIILQMFFTKGLAASKLLEGLSYTHGDVTLNPIIDHTLLFILARNLCETLTAFELIAMLPDSDEKRTIMERLFENSGYKYRLRLYSPEMQLVHKEQYETEQKIVQDAKATILKTSYYQTLPKEQQKLLRDLIKRKSYQVILSTNEVRQLSWQEALSIYVAPNGLFDNIYTYFSLMTHPSIIAMNQFDQAFAKDDPEYPRLCITAILYILSFMSMFLQEYIAIFPDAKVLFDEQSDDIQGLLKMYDYRKNKN